MESALENQSLNTENAQNPNISWSQVNIAIGFWILILKKINYALVTNFKHSIFN